MIEFQGNRAAIGRFEESRPERAMNVDTASDYARDQFFGSIDKVETVRNMLIFSCFRVFVVAFRAATGAGP
jgi:hypothetical protein